VTEFLKEDAPGELEGQLSLFEGLRESLRSALDRPRLRGRVRPSAMCGVDCGPEEDAITQQQFRNECDINTIVRRFGLSGAEPVMDAGGVYGDFTGIEDLSSAVEAVRRAQLGFEALRPEIREYFRNDPVVMAEFASRVDEAEFEGVMRSLTPVEEPPAGPAAPVPPAAPQAPSEGS